MPASNLIEHKTRTHNQHHRHHTLPRLVQGCGADSVGGGGGGEDGGGRDLLQLRARPRGGAAVEAGSCAEPHHAEYCAGVDWCVKTWRGNTSAMSGEHVTRVYWDYWDTWTRLHGIMGLQIQGRGTWLVAGTRGTCELRRVVTPVSIQIELSQPVD